MDIDWKKYETNNYSQKDINWDKYGTVTPVKKDIDWGKYEQATPVQKIIPPQEPNIIQDVLSYIKEHPIKSILQPLPKTLGGETPKEALLKRYERKPEGEQWTPAFLRSLGTRMAGEAGNIATTPISYIPIPIGRALGKIPFRGTTIGEVAKRIPVGKGFVGKATELGRYEQALKMMSPLSSRGISADPVSKIVQALKEAKPIRATQEVLYTAERAKRAGQIVEVGQTVPGEQGYFAQLGALKGELPKVQFEGIRGKISQPDIDSLFNIVEKNNVLSPYEKITTKTGLAKLLGAEGGAVPTQGEIGLLSQVFPPDFIRTVLSKRPLMQKVFEGGAEVLNVPRAIMASTDLSFLLRQGMFAIRHPLIFARGAKEQFKYFFSEKAYQGLYDDIVSRPTYPLMRTAKLDITKIGGRLAQREEAFMSNLAEKIPVFGKVVRASDRAYTGLANKLRADWFDWMVNTAQKQGLKVEGKLLKDIGNFANTATGRGNLGAFERAAVVLNTALFSPRLMASRLSLLNPFYYTGLNPFVRKEALKSLLTFAGAGLGILSLEKMGGMKVGTEPRSADFGKAKIGNTRYDHWAGFQQYIRLAAQLITGEHISSTTGVKTTVGEGYKPLTRADILGRFLETKESPVASFALGLLKGQTNLGQKFNVAQEVASRFVPMVIQDMYDLYKERGLEGIMMATPAIFGVGLQTYSPTPTEIVYSTKSVIKHTKELLNQGRKEEARKLYLRNENLLKMGEKLEPLQKKLSEQERIRNFVVKAVDLTPEQKKKGLTYTEMMIKKFGKMMLEKYKEIK